jgi:pyridoxal phosphate enzyme (YggS family)
MKDEFSSPYPSFSIGDNVRAVLEGIRLAAARAGRPPAAVQLIAATKSVAVERIREAVDAGIRTVGENRVPEALQKMEIFGSRADVGWHFIGRLQRRKARAAVGRFGLIHSVDSLELALELDRRAEAAGIEQAVLVEVNIAGEPTKAGFAPAELPTALTALDGLRRLCVRGLMAVPPLADDPEASRPHFRRLRELAGSCAGLGLTRVRLEELSMGMSHDYRVAVEEGATMVRIGTAIFGARDA